MESTRKIIAAVLAIACIVQPMTPCRCQSSLAGFGGVCCDGITTCSQHEGQREHACSHLHSEHRRNADVVADPRDADQDTPTPKRPKSPHCHCQSWIALANSQDRNLPTLDAEEVIPGQAWQSVRLVQSIESLAELRHWPGASGKVRCLCRMQV